MGSIISTTIIARYANDKEKREKQPQSVFLTLLRLSNDNQYEKEEKKTSHVSQQDTAVTVEHHEEV